MLSPKLDGTQLPEIIPFIIEEYIEEDHAVEQTRNRIAAQKIQQNILKLLQDELGVDAVLPLCLQGIDSAGILKHFHYYICIHILLIFSNFLNLLA